MAGKRTATNDLSHDNWNQEDEPEERGTFQKASEGIIKSPKRRNPIGFSSGSSGNKKSEQHGARLSESVSKWIAKKVEENPLISLQLFFMDYEKHLGEIEQEESSAFNIDKPVNNSNTTNSIPTFNFVPSADQNTKAILDRTSEKIGHKMEESPISTFKYGRPTASASSSGPTYSFGASIGTSSFTSTPRFSLGSNNSTGSITFPTSSGFSFGDATKSVQPEKTNEDEPPKFEFKSVFVQACDSFGDRGVGNIYLKPIENSEKLQVPWLSKMGENQDNNKKIGQRRTRSSPSVAAHRFAQQRLKRQMEKAKDMEKAKVMETRFIAKL